MLISGILFLFQCLGLSVYVFLEGILLVTNLRFVQ